MPVGPDHPIARELRAARAYSGKSRLQIAGAVDISADTLGGWERGAFTRDPPRPMLAAIADFTGMPATFTYVVAVKPSVTARARSAADRLDDTHGASSETNDVPDAEDEGR